MGKHTHTHTEEIFYFLSGTGLKEVAAYVITGTGELEVNGRGFRLEAGSAALLLKDSAVIFRADQQLELLLVSLFTPKD